MLTTGARRQLLVFLTLALVSTAYVGARYARLDRLVLDTSYEVTAQFRESGGIFVGAEVSYRGVRIGRVSDMRLTRDGVDVILTIDDGWGDIPSDTLAEVADKSAVGEQYVDLQPRTDTGPRLKDGSVIAQRDTAIPVSPTQVLTSVDDLVDGVPEDSLRTTISEMGSAFRGSGDDLARMIDNSDEFIKTATENLGVTSALIRDSNQVLRTQARKGSAIRGFSRDLALLSGTVAANDRAVRRLIDNGSATADELRSFLQENSVDLAGLLNNLVTTGEVVAERLPGIRQILVLYPYVVAGGYTVVARSPDGFQTRSGLILGPQPDLCTHGYDPRQQRPPTDGTNKPMDEDAHCADPPTRSNPRGSQNAPRVAPGPLASTDTVATYDVGTGRLTWSDADNLDPRFTEQESPGTSALARLLWLPLT